MWTLRRIGQLIEWEFGIAYGKTNVWLLLKAMGFSCQRPAGVPASGMKRRFGNGSAHAGH
jgi:transposase